MSAHAFVLLPLEVLRDMLGNIQMLETYQEF